MKTISKRIFVFLIVGLLSFCSVEMTYYKSVHAFEWVTAGISTVEALKWLLGAMGIIATVGAVHENFWDGYEEEFYEYASDENIAGPDVRAWLEKLAKGTLDKGSEVWECFKSWASSLVSSSSGEGAIVGSLTFEKAVSLINEKYGTSFSISSEWNHSNIIVTNIIVLRSADKYFVRFIYTTNSSDGIPSLNMFYTGTYNQFYVENTSGRQVFYFYYGDISSDYVFNNYGSHYCNPNSYIDLGYIFNEFNISIYNISRSGSAATNPNISVLDVSQDLYTINDARQEQFDIINRTTANEVEEEVAIPMPGVSSGDDTISQDVYDNIIERVNNGDISVDDAVKEVQQTLQVLVYDTATDDVIPVTPDSDDPTQNEDKDDVIKNEKSNMGFTLAGLENVFPFCIPWDIYAFLNLLDAEPVAPVFNIPFPNINDPTHPLTTEVDLSSWDDAMRIVRLAQDFLFIIGLAFLTRNLIGAGGGD